MTLDGAGDILEYEDGDEVFSEGSPGDCLYIVESGAVAVRKQGEVVSTVIAEFGPGEMFGEMALVDSRPHSAAARAIGDTRVRILDRDAFLDALEHDPELALRVIESLALRLRDTTEKLQQIATQHVLDRTEIMLVQKAVLESDLG
jgi:CRP-like cAMP-binding protein